MSISNIRGVVERVSFDASERRELMVVLSCEAAPHRVLELSVHDDVKRGQANALRLTQPGDMLELTVQKSSNGVDGLTLFANVTLEEHLVAIKARKDTLSKDFPWNTDVASMPLNKPVLVRMRCSSEPIPFMAYRQSGYKSDHFCAVVGADHEMLRPRGPMLPLGALGAWLDVH